MQGILTKKEEKLSLGTQNTTFRRYYPTEDWLSKMLDFELFIEQEDIPPTRKWVKMDWND